MQTRFSIVPLVITVAVVLGSWPPASAANDEEQAAAELDIRAAVALAMTDGLLSPAERSAVLFKASRACRLEEAYQATRRALAA